ncbi:MAG: pyridoxamine 5'-phosphate oxidase [Gemmatimonadetes bacterium]|nr:MAG: pyridoxamine 5'-phosphate oxidase [Gemmatimonadota bacterium]
MTIDLSELRRVYSENPLTKADVDPNPFCQFRRWFGEALQADFYEPNAMVLSTVSAEGKPSARTVLLKGFDERGFVFYTNYHSRKGRELAQNPYVALTFYWDVLVRDIRIEGKVEKVPPEVSDMYFQSRPRGSQLGTWVSNQSEIIESRQVLLDRLQQLEVQYADAPIPRPPYWGGYRVSPTAFEFWQGGENRLHDRILYTLTDDGVWTIARLAP